MPLNFLNSLLDVMPSVWSVSYGISEAKMVAFDELVQQIHPGTPLRNRTNTEFQKMGAQGISIFVAAGDTGVSEARGDATSPSQSCGFFPIWPASSPYVTAVGGTQPEGGLAIGAEVVSQASQAVNALAVGEITSGGGFSLGFSAPSYQSDVVQAYVEGSTANIAPNNPVLATCTINEKLPNYPLSHVLRIRASTRRVAATQTCRP